MRRTRGPGPTAPDSYAAQKPRPGPIFTADADQRPGMCNGILEEASQVAARCGATRAEWVSALERALEAERRGLAEAQARGVLP